MSTLYLQYPQSGGGGSASTGSQTGVPYVVGPLGGAASNAQGGTIGSFTFYQQVATATFPGLVSSAAQTFAGIKTFNNGIFSTGIDAVSNPITNVLDPVSPQQAATKNYVDTQLAAFQPLEAVVAASALTDYPGVQVGNVLTITATGAISVDGVTPAANARILLKDQNTASQNGVYVVTTVGTIGVSPVLTRAADYNTAAAINSGASIPVLSGTLNKLTSWIQTATVVTVNTDSLVFNQFSANPQNVPISVGALDGASAKPSGATIGSSALYMQSASATNPGLVSSALQSFAGTKTLAGAFLPATDNTYSLGTSSLRFLDGYFQNIVTVGSVTAGTKNYISISQNGSGQGATVRFGTGGSGPLYSQIYYDGIALRGADSNGYNYFQFTNNTKPTYVFYDQNNAAMFTLNSNSLTTTVQTYAPMSTSPILVVGSVTISQNPVGNTYPWTLPASQGSASWILQNNGLGSLSWTAPNPFVSPLTTSGDIIVASGSGVASRLAVGSTGLVLNADPTQAFGVAWGSPRICQQKTVGSGTVGNAYTVSLSDQIIFANCSIVSTPSITLPTAIGNNGQTFKFIKTDFVSAADEIRINTVSSQSIIWGSISSSSVFMKTQGEQWEIISDNVAWRAITHEIPSIWTAYTPTNSQGFGSLSFVNLIWKRSGANLEIMGRATSGIATGVDCQINLPFSFAADPIALSSTSIVGQFVTNQLLSVQGAVLIDAINTPTIMNFSWQNSSFGGLNKQIGTNIAASNTPFSFNASIPILHWMG